MTDQLNIPSSNRRNFFRSAAVAGVAVAVPSWLLSACSNAGPGTTATTAGGGTTMKATHGTGFCNLGIFLVKERNLAQADGAKLEFVVTPTNADIVTLFGAGKVDVPLIPYTQFLTLRDAGAPVTIVAGGGVQGCVIVARQVINSAAVLRGK